MKQLTVGALSALMEHLPDDMVVYLGNDEELNGTHEAYFVQTVEKDELNEMGYGSDYDKGGLLIS